MKKTIISVQTKAKAKHGFVRRLSDNTFSVAVTKPPQGGKANLALIDALAAYFKIPRHQIAITSGLKSKRKTVTVVSSE